MTLDEASARIRIELDFLIARDAGVGPVETLVAGWAHEVSATLGFPVIVIPGPRGLVSYPVPQPAPCSTSAPPEKP